jgi:hypothetical protein
MVHTTSKEMREYNEAAFCNVQGCLSGKWGADAKSLFVGAADHNLRLFDLAASGPTPME